MLKTAPFLIAIVAIFFTLAFPSPKDFIKVPQVLPDENAIGLVETSSAPTARSLSADMPIEPTISKIEQSGCLDRLSLLPKEMIDNCSKLVADAVIQIAADERDDLLVSSDESMLLVERLRLAAANVCRARWVTDTGLSFHNDDPVCAISTFNLASND